MKRQPTTRENVSSRLFLRYFLLLFAGVAIMLTYCLRTAPQIASDAVGKVQVLFVCLALLAAFLTVSGPYLVLLCGVKAFFDTAAFCTRIRSLTLGKENILPVNGLLCYFVLSAILFCTMASQARLFSFEGDERDLKLMYSRRFLLFLPRAVLLIALALPFYYIWPRLAAYFTETAF